MNGKVNEETYYELKKISNRKDVQSALWEFLKNNKPTTKRTLSQNNSIHLYLSKISEQLQAEGHTLQDVVKAIRKAQIIPTMEALKEIVWKPIQEIMYKKKSTTQLKKLGEIDNVHLVVDAFFAREFGVTYPFPSKNEGNLAELASDKVYEKGND